MPEQTSQTGMTGAAIAQLILVLGPVALELIPKLIANWSKDLSPEEVLTICKVARTSAAEYRQWAKDVIAGKITPDTDPGQPTNAGQPTGLPVPVAHFP